MKQVCLLLVFTAFLRLSDAQISLKGTVTGAENEKLAGAYVTVDNSLHRNTTNNEGMFLIEGLKPGNYQVKISYVGYHDFVQHIRLQKDTSLSIQLKEQAAVSDAVIISAVRASQNAPTTFTTLSTEDISRNNTGKDLPYILNFEPSVVTTSDAGTGIGYTGLRIRGSDITRINVTINGIPLNDPESHSVYWVDIPDFASSAGSLQLQRGVGSSTNGAGVFGASMNIETSPLQANPYGIISTAAGSFKTWRTTLIAGTGLIKNRWYFEGRASSLGSDGYIDRASSELSSFFLQGGYSNGKTLIKTVVFGGKEKTYQAWYGVDEYTMNIDRKYNWAGAIYNEDGSIDFYKDQADNYRQDHYQLHLSQKISDVLNINVSAHYTPGKGYYEEYRQDEDFTDYGLSYPVYGSDTIRQTDLIRRRWLDNHFYGITWSLHYQKGKIDFIAGGAANKYDKARHFGEIIWAEFAENVPKDFEYYNNTAFKTDLNVFTKIAWSPVERLTIYGDVQYRTLNYKVHGIESHLNAVSIDENFNFLNPKIGFSYFTNLGTLYASYSIAHREPIRDDYIDAPEGEKPQPETLGNFEIGIRKSEANLKYALNYYLMNYSNQLVLTGEINDDGAYVRKNSGKSYRTGVELNGSYQPFRYTDIAGNISLSLNKTDYKEVNEENVLTTYKNKNIAFSPSITGSFQWRIYPLKNMELAWMGKYVGKQYLNNTGDENLTLDPYFVNDARWAYTIYTGEKGPVIELLLTLYNILNTEYESNGSVYDGSPYYYPQAGSHIMCGLNIKF